MRMGGTTYRIKNSVKDIAIRTGLRPYRPMGWTGQRWEDSFSAHATDAFTNPNEAARYGVLTGYVATIGEGPSILDIGCGAGILRSRLAREHFARYLGVDPT